MAAVVRVSHFGIKMTNVAIKLIQKHTSSVDFYQKSYRKGVQTGNSNVFIDPRHNRDAEDDLTERGIIFKLYLTKGETQGLTKCLIMRFKAILRGRSLRRCRRCLAR